MMHEELAIDILNAENGVQIGGEQRDMAVSMNAKDAVGGSVAGQAHIDWILRHEYAAIGSGTNHTRMNELWRFSDHLHLPIGGGLGALPGGGFQRCGWGAGGGEKFGTSHVAVSSAQ